MKRVVKIGLRKFCFVVCLMLLAASAVTICSAQRRGITVYQDIYFAGRAVTFRNDVPDLQQQYMNDWISSYRVPPGEQWEICEDIYYRGQCIVVTGEDPDLQTTGWNDRISSLRRLRGGGGGGVIERDYIVLFDQTNYRGNPINFYEAQTNINSRIRSVTIGRGTWELCDGRNFTGRCQILTQSTPDLRSYNIGQNIRSIRPAGFVGPQPFPPSRDWYIVLFDDENYRGAPANYNGEYADISKRARSVTIGRGVWEVCDGRNFTGRCVTLRQSIPNMRIYNVGQTIRSVRPVGPQLR